MIIVALNMKYSAVGDTDGLVILERAQYNLNQAQELLLNTWKPAYEMSNDSNFKCNFKSQEEFYEYYKLSKMPILAEQIYRLSIQYDGEHNIITDTEGYVNLRQRYIPNIWDKGINIISATIYKYENRDKSLIVEELIIEEQGNSYEYNGFNRKSIYRRDSENQWFLYDIDGNITSNYSIMRIRSPKAFN